MADTRTHNQTRQQPATGFGGHASPAWCDSFVAILQEQRRLIDALNMLSERQRSLIAMDDPAPLISLVDQRQELISRIEQVMARLGPMQTLWNESRTALPGGTVLDVNAKIEAIAAIARGIAARDAEDQALLAARKREIAAELSQMSGGQRAMNAYAGVGPGRDGERSGVSAFEDREA